MNITPAGQQSTSPNRTLWIVVGVLGAAVLAMGVALIQMQSRPAVPLAAPTPALAVPVPRPDAAASVTPAVLPEPAPPAASTAPVQVVKKVVLKQPAKVPAQTKPVPEATPVPASVPAEVVVVPPPVPAKPVCLQCGVVESVTPVEHEATPTGVGAVAGAVIGGVLGNQVGGGDGKTIATVVGAIGGGWAGNTVEKHMKKVTVYQVDVRMEDGSVQRIEHANAIAVGAHVTVRDGAITP